MQCTTCTTVHSGPVCVCFSISHLLPHPAPSVPSTVLLWIYHTPPHLQPCVSGPHVSESPPESPSPPFSVPPQPGLVHTSPASSPMPPSMVDRAPAWDMGNLFFLGWKGMPLTPSPCHCTESQDPDMSLRYTSHGAMNESRDSVCTHPCLCCSVSQPCCMPVRGLPRQWGAACLLLLRGMMWSVPIWSVLVWAKPGVGGGELAAPPTSGCGSGSLSLGCCMCCSNPACALFLWGQTETGPSRRTLGRGGEGARIEANPGNASSQVK